MAYRWSYLRLPLLELHSRTLGAQSYFRKFVKLFLVLILLCWVRSRACHWGLRQISLRRPLRCHYLHPLVRVRAASLQLGWVQPVVTILRIQVLCSELSFLVREEYRLWTSAALNGRFSAFITLALLVVSIHVRLRAIAQVRVAFRPCLQMWHFWRLLYLAAGVLLNCVWPGFRWMWTFWWLILLLYI